MGDISATVKNFILQEFLPGENPDELTASVPLMSSGILDSIATLKLVTFLEEQFKIELQPYETDETHMGTIADICELVESKLGS